MKDTKNTFIHNNDALVCKKCIHYRKHVLKPDFLAKCSLYANKDLLSGKIKYQYAYKVRNDEEKCGINATYFEEKTTADTFSFDHYIQLLQQKML
jgi:hypothetical protein